MIKKLLHILIILTLISVSVYGAEDFEFGPYMYVSENGTEVNVPNAADAENTAFAVEDSSIMTKSMTDSDILCFDFLCKDFNDTSFVIADTKNNEVIIFSLDSTGRLASHDESNTAVIEADSWHSIIIAKGADELFVYLDGEVFTVVPYEKNMRGIYRAGFEEGTLYYDNVEFSAYKTPAISRVANLSLSDGLSQAQLLFDAPVVIDGTACTEYVYYPSEPLDYGEISYATIHGTDLLNNEITISCPIKGGRPLEPYFINSLSLADSLVRMDMTVFNPCSTAVSPVIYSCVFADDTLEDIKIYKELSFEPGFSSAKIPVDYSQYTGDIRVRLFVWQNDITPYDSLSYLGEFEIMTE